MAERQPLTTSPPPGADGALEAELDYVRGPRMPFTDIHLTAKPSLLRVSYPGTPAHEQTPRQEDPVQLHTAVENPKDRIEPRNVELGPQADSESDWEAGHEGPQDPNPEVPGALDEPSTHLAQGAPGVSAAWVQYPQEGWTIEVRKANDLFAKDFRDFAQCIQGPGSTRVRALAESPAILLAQPEAPYSLTAMTMEDARAL